MEFITAYGPKNKVSIIFPDKGRTKQAFKAECDINNIMSKYQKTGLIEHGNAHSPMYGEFTPLDFREAMNTVIEAQDMFNDLPSSTRKRFNNDPAEFLEFVQNPDNADAMREMGLMRPATASEGPVVGPSETDAANVPPESPESA